MSALSIAFRTAYFQQGDVLIFPVTRTDLIAHFLEDTADVANKDDMIVRHGESGGVHELVYGEKMELTLQNMSDDELNLIKFGDCVLRRVLNGQVAVVEPEGGTIIESLTPATTARLLQTPPHLRSATSNADLLIYCEGGWGGLVHREHRMNFVPPGWSTVKAVQAFDYASQESFDVLD